MSNAGLKRLVAGVAGRELLVCFGMAVKYWVRLSNPEGRTGIVSGPFDQVTEIRRYTASGVQKAVVRLSIWLIIRAILERIGVAGVANVCEGGHFKAVDARIMVDIFEVSSGMGSRFNCSPADCVVVCDVLGSSGSVAGKLAGGGIGASGCCFGVAVVVCSVDDGNLRFQ